MPPIPQQTHVFSDPDITLSISSLQQRQTYLASTVIPHLTTLPPTTPLHDQQRLSSELREDLDDFGRRVEALEQLIEDLRDPKEREIGRRVVQEWANVYAGLKRDARNALLASKRAIDQHAKSRRDELLGSVGVLNAQDKRNEKTDDALMRTTATLTDALRRTEARLRAELDRSMLSTQLLTSQTSTLRQTSDAHGRLGGLLETSKGLITALERTDWLDRMLILGGLAVFLLACAWIVKVRVVDRAVGIAFWWVRFLPSISSAEDRIMEELERGARMVGGSSVTSTIAEAVTAATQSVLGSSPSLSSVLSEAGTTLASSVDVTAEIAIPQLREEGKESLLDTINSATTMAMSHLTGTEESLSLPTRTLRSILRDEL